MQTQRHCIDTDTLSCWCCMAGAHRQLSARGWPGYPAAGKACLLTRKAREVIGPCRQEPPELTRLFVAIPVPIGPLESLLHKFEADIIRVLRNVSHMPECSLGLLFQLATNVCMACAPVLLPAAACHMAVMKCAQCLLCHPATSLQAKVQLLSPGCLLHSEAINSSCKSSPCCRNPVHQQSQHHQDCACLVVLLQAPNCPVHNQSSIITNSTRTRAGVLIECLDDVALPLIRETLLKNPPEFMLSPQGVHCMLCMLYSTLLPALAASTGHSTMQQMLLSNRPDLVLPARGRCCMRQQSATQNCLLQAAAPAAFYTHTVMHHKLLPAGVRPLGPAFGGRFGPDPRAGDRRPLGRGNPREDRSVLFIREVGASAALVGSLYAAGCTIMVDRLQLVQRVPLIDHVIYMLRLSRYPDLETALFSCCSATSHHSVMPACDAVGAYCGQSCSMGSPPSCLHARVDCRVCPVEQSL